MITGEATKAEIHEDYTFQWFFFFTHPLAPAIFSIWKYFKQISICLGVGRNWYNFVQMSYLARSSIGPRDTSVSSFKLGN